MTFIEIIETRIFQLYHMRSLHAAVSLYNVVSLY